MLGQDSQRKEMTAGGGSRCHFGLERSGCTIAFVAWSAECLPFVAVRIVAETEARVVREEMVGLKRCGGVAVLGQEMNG